MVMGNLDEIFKGVEYIENIIKKMVLSQKSSLGKYYEFDNLETETGLTNIYHGEFDDGRKIFVIKNPEYKMLLIHKFGDIPLIEVNSENFYYMKAQNILLEVSDRFNQYNQ